ncbi:MAG: TA system VapC family ribonuclease toxin [bacterium]
MSVTIDANVLIYSMNEDAHQHNSAARALTLAMQSGEPVWLFPPTIVAILRVMTHPRLSRRPLSLHEAFMKIRQLLQQPEVNFGSPLESFVEDLASVAMPPDATGKLIHDAEIVALMKQHGVDRILTADRDFLRFEGIAVTLFLNP